MTQQHQDVVAMREDIHLSDGSLLTLSELSLEDLCDIEVHLEKDFGEIMNSGNLGGLKGFSFIAWCMCRGMNVSNHDRERRNWAMSLDKFCQMIRNPRDLQILKEAVVPFLERSFSLGRENSSSSDSENSDSVTESA